MSSEFSGVVPLPCVFVPDEDTLSRSKDVRKVASSEDTPVVVRGYREQGQS
jgi:hypothetical protein